MILVINMVNMMIMNDMVICVEMMAIIVMMAHLGPCFLFYSEISAKRLRN